MAHKIIATIPAEQLQKDLEKYRQRALEIGATDAKIITTDMLSIDERARAKCLYPKCASYGTNAHCPPYAMDLDQVRKIVNNFQYAILTMKKVPSEDISGVTDKNKKPPTPIDIEHHVKNFEIVSKIEAEAFYDGYYFALGFAAGPCKRAFCPNEECSALVPGQPCRYPWKARSSMEGVGMDVYNLATKVGWDIFPFGLSSPPSEIPYGLLLGLVLIY